MRAVVIIATLAISPSVAVASDPGDRTFTPLGGGTIGGAAGVAASGNLAAALPLLLPSPRGGLPLPLVVSYTGSNRVGAAGVGWDIPIAGVTWQHNISRRKPLHRFQGQADPVTADRVFLDIGGGPVLMSPTNTPGVYQTFSSGYFELTLAGSGFTGRDASGRVWVFEKLPALYDDDFFPLVRVTDAGGTNRVDLRYDIYDKFSPNPVSYPYPQNQLSMRELVLRELSYSHDESGACPKYRIELDYTNWASLNYPVPYPGLLGLDFEAGRPRARTRLLRSVTVRSNANVLCLAPDEITERTYRISYAPDELTGQPRLRKVDVFGARDPGTDPSTALPVVAYRYGSLLFYVPPQNVPPAHRLAISRFPVHPLGWVEIQYAAAEQLTLPSAPVGPNDGFSASYGAGAGNMYGFVRDFRDFDGDGRADFVTLNAAGTNPVLAINSPSPLGNDYSTFNAPVNLPNAPAAPYNLGAPDLAFNLPVVATIDNTYQQVIDFNGDGRPDIVVATEGRNPSGDRDPNYWMILVNTPGPSGQPSDIVWLERQIDISALRAEIQQTFTLSPVASSDQNSKFLPVARTHQVGLFDSTTMLESGIVTQWKLLDMNGDGFPDFVFDRLGVDAWTEQRCDSGGNCKDVTRQDRPAGNSLMVIYHTGPMMAGSGADTQNQWNGPAVTLRSDGACGVERMTWMGGGLRQMKCGFMEVNGDGLVDYVIDDPSGIRAILSSGLAQDHDIRLPENQIPPDYAQQEAKRAIILPGPVGQVKDPLSTVCTPNTSGTQHYNIEQLTALRDLTGDGIADYVYFGSRGALVDGTPLSHPTLTEADREGPQGWWFMAGTGVGFAEPRTIRTPIDLPFALYTSRERCDGTSSSVIAALRDIDGDGRPDLVRAGRFATVRIAKIVDPAGQLGAHSAGQLIAIDNRFGSVTRVTYGSAKSSWLTRQGVPFPQIVVTQLEQTAERGLGNPLVPVRYAYGSSELLYHPLLGRWVFSGYRRRVELVGEPTPTFGVIKGTARISDSLASTEPNGDLDRLALAGRVRDLNVVAGWLPDDPRALLADDSLSSASANQHTSWRTQALPGNVPILVPLEEECYQTPPPQTPGIFGDLTLCRRTATVYAAERTTWEGNQPYPSPESVATRTEVSAVDDYARPTRVRVEGDRARTDDDYCIDISYASRAAAAPFVSDAPHTVRAYDCTNISRVFAGIRYAYDGLPEGQVGIGFPSGRILERHNVETTQLLEQLQSGTLQRDLLGNPVLLTRTRPDGATATTRLTYDAFGLKPVRTETTATGLPQPLVAEVARDPNTLLPMTLLDSNGTATHNSFDRFGRLTRVSISLPGDSTNYVLLDTVYLRFDGSPGGREVRHRFYQRWTDELSADTAGPASVTGYTEVLDELGRRMHGIVDLGPDYGGQSLIVNSVVYDGLGRPLFVADPFPSTIFGPRYGASFSYRADGRPDCLIEGLAPQTVATTDETVDRYPTCMSYVYQNGQLLVRGRGPNELAQGKPQSGAFDEDALSATGKVLQRSRVSNGSLLELIEYRYDRLGTLSWVRRWADPEAGTGAAAWSFTNDSLGAVLAMQEPAGVTRSYTYDAWGRVATVNWRDSTGIVAVQRGISFQYDGLARLLRSTEILNGEPQPATAKEYFYDTGSGQPPHLDAQYLLGRLSYARTQGSSAFFGYDPLGRLTTISRSSGDDAAYHAERAAFGPSGNIESLDLLLPDTGHAPERVSYTYDTARRLQAVNYQDGVGTTEIWRALQTDVFGRVLQAKLGNGATEQHTYRPDRRREVQSARVDAGTRSRLVLLNGYDGAMLLKGTSEQTSLTTSSQTVTTYSYDARNALARAVMQDSSGPVADTSYAYDGLGNLRSITDNIGSASLEIKPDAADPDRICTVGPPGGPTSPCNYRYDATGNVWQMHGTGALLSYDAAGRLRSAEQGGRLAQLDYDPFGSIASLKIRSGNVERRERIYGGVSAQVGFFDAAGNEINVGDPGATFQNFVERRIVSPVGILAVIRRPNVGQPVILYPIGDYQGVRAVIGSNATSTEAISYTPFGSVVSDSGNPQSLAWWPYQWNGGHVLDGFGLVALGQRVLDPRTGRFLQRDPLVHARTAGTANPYTFAWNNPVKFTDPTGADPKPDQGGTIASGLAAFGKLVYRDPTTPGPKIDPHIEMDWACNADHDCISAVESVYPLTDFEKELRQEFHRGKRSVATHWGTFEYHVIMDRVSGALLGYAFFDTNVYTIYDRQGKGVGWGGLSEPTAATWFQPGDFIAGPLASWVGFGESAATQGIRSAEAAIEADLADEAAAGGVAGGMARRPPPWKYDFNIGPTAEAGYTTWEGDIFLNWRLQPGTELFKETLRHEGVHRWFTPLRGILVSQRQNWRKWWYESSTFLRYTEEAIAEGVGTRSLLQGLRYPFADPLLNIGTGRLVLEGGLFTGGVYGSYKAGQWIRGEWDSR